MVNWAAHYDAIYASLGIDAVLAPAEGDPVSVRVIDKIRATIVGEGAGVDVHAFRPACTVRKEQLDLNNIPLSDLDGGTITIHGETWRIDAHSHDSPAGPSTGEVWLMLRRKPEDEPDPEAPEPEGEP